MFQVRMISSPAPRDDAAVVRGSTILLRLVYFWRTHLLDIVITAGQCFLFSPAEDVWYHKKTLNRKGVESYYTFD